MANRIDPPVEIVVEIIGSGPRGAVGPAGLQGKKGDPGATGPQGTPTTVNGKSGESITLRMEDILIADDATGELYKLGAENGKIYYEAVTEGGE